MKKITASILNFVVLSFVFSSLTLMPVLAADGPLLGGQLKEIEKPSDLPTTPFMQMFGNGIKIFLGFMGVFCFILIIIAGVKWMSSNGEKDGIEGAKKTLFAAIGGLILIFIAYPLSTYIIQMIESMAK